jgi:hypothetical protein
MYTVKIETKITKQLTSSSLGEDISKLITRCNKLNIKRIQSNLPRHEMKMQLDVLGTGMEHRIGGQVTCPQIIST